MAKIENPIPEGMRKATQSMEYHLRMYAKYLEEVNKYAKDLKHEPDASSIIG